MPLADQIAQLRYNTTLLVGADGTGLLNAVCICFIDVFGIITLYLKKFVMLF